MKTQKTFLIVLTVLTATVVALQVITMIKKKNKNPLDSPEPKILGFAEEAELIED